MKTILITAIAGDIAQSVAQIVRQARPDWRIVGVDVHGLHGGSLYVDRLDDVVLAADPSFQRSLERIVERHGIDYVLLMSEAELRWLRDARPERIAGARIVGACRRALEIGLDKLATARFIESIGLPAPWTTDADSGPPQQVPCIFKPRWSAGSKGVVICRDLEESAWHARRCPRGVFQELLLPDEAEVTCAVYRDRSGQTATLPILRRLVGGFTGWGRVIDSPAALEQCRRIADALDLHGSINVQMRITGGGPRVFEINPRFSSTVGLRHLLGFSDVLWMLDELDARLPAYPMVPVGAEIVRTQGAAIIKPGARGA